MALNFLIRDVVPGDLEALYCLDQLCFEPGIAYSREEMRTFLARPAARGVAAELGGPKRAREGTAPRSAGPPLGGFAVGHLEPGRIARVVTLDVHPDHRRRGLGKLLLGELLGRLSRDGARESRLEVDSGNAGAIAFYQALGFRRRRLVQDYYGPGRAALEMRRTENGGLSLTDQRPPAPSR